MSANTGPLELPVSDYKFYLDTDPVGKTYTFFRALEPGGFERGDLERAMPDGSWSGAEKDICGSRVISTWKMTKFLKLKPLRKLSNGIPRVRALGALFG